MTMYIEDHLPIVKFQGLNTAKSVDLSAATSIALPATGITTGVVEVVQFVGQTTEAATDRVIFVATQACKIIAISESHAVAAGGASALQVTKDTGTTAPGAGTDLLTNNTNTGFDLNATANTVQVGALVATAATVTLAAGDRLSIDFAQAIQSTAGLTITITLVTV